MSDTDKLKAILWPEGHAIKATEDQTRAATKAYYSNGGLQTFFDHPNPLHPNDPMKRLGYRLAFYPLNP